MAVVGEAGLGKSRLVAEARQSLSDGIVWVEGRALAYTQGMSYWLVCDVLRGLIDVDRNTPPEEVGGILRKNVEALFPDRVADVHPYLARLLDLPLDQATAERVKYLSPEALQGQIFRAFRDYLRAHALNEPLALVWEDLHWADPSSLQLLETLLPLTREIALGMIFVFRPAQEGRALEFHRRTARTCGERYGIIELGPLTRAESTQMVQNLLQIETLPEETRRLILDKAEGNPFFLEELLRSLMDAGLVVLQEGRAVATREIRGLQVPDTLEGLIAARIDCLPQEDKHALQTASVIGRVFQQRVLAYLFEQEQSNHPLDASLRELQRRELIRRREAELALADVEYIFKHAVTHEVAYNSLLRARRKALHRVAGEAMEELFPDSLSELAAMLAYHYERAELADKAIHYLIKAAERARLIYASEEAIALYRAAIKQVNLLKTEQPAQWAQQAGPLHESLGDALLQAARYEEARAAYGDALSHVPERENVHRAHLLRRQGNAWFDQRRSEESLPCYDLAEAVLGPEPSKVDSEWWQEWVAIQLDRTGPYHLLGRLSELTELVEKVQPLVEQYGRPSQLRDLVDSLNLIDYRRHRFYMLPDETLRRGRTLLAASRESGDLNEIAYYQFLLGFIHLWRDELKEAEEELQESLKLAVRIGDAALQTKCSTFLTVTHRKRGHVEATRDCASRSLSQAMAGQNLMYTAFARANLAWAEWREGNPAQAEKAGRAALELWPKNYPMRWMALWPLLGMALLQNQVAEAMGRARALLDPKESRLPEDLTAALEQAIRAWETSEPETVRAHLQRASELARQKGYL